MLPFALIAPVARSSLRAPRDVLGLLAEGGALAEYAGLRRAPVFAGEGVPRGDGQPVLVLPGFLGEERSVQVLGRWLHRMGHRPHRAGRRPNVGCAGAAVDRIERRAEEISAAHDGRRLAVVGHSRGGQLARALAVRRPDLVDRVVTLGTPGPDTRGMSTAVVVPVLATAALGSLGVPGLFRAACLRGACCAEVREALVAPLPDGVRHVAVHSPRDHIVDDAAFGAPHAEPVSVDATHLGMVVNAEVYGVIAQVLAPRAA